MTKKRHMVLTEEMLRRNPHICDPNASSFDTRQDILATEVPKLGKEAAIQAIKDWGQPKSKITHVVFCTSCGVDLPGADFRLTKLLGLKPSIKRFMLYSQGCHAGGTVLRFVKDIAENNRGARVLVVCSESMVVCFHGPTETTMASMVGAALFGDGAVALIVGADPDESVERPLFQIVRATQTYLPNSEDAVAGPLREIGMDLTLRKDTPELISKDIDKVLEEALSEFGVKIDDWNSIFWAVHPGGPAILDQVEAKLGLKEDKFNATRHVMNEFGNMFSASVLFVLDELRKRSLKERKATTGEGLEWGLLLGFGPGITVETVMLRSVALHG